jgi:hypothetical protein
MKWSASRPDTFTPGVIAPSTNDPEVVWAPETVSDDVEKKQISPCRESNPDLPGHSALLYGLSCPDSCYILLTRWNCVIMNAGFRRLGHLPFFSSAVHSLANDTI